MSYLTYFFNFICEKKTLHCSPSILCLSIMNPHNFVMLQWDIGTSLGMQSTAAFLQLLGCSKLSLRLQMVVHCNYHYRLWLQIDYCAKLQLFRGLG